MGEAILTTPMMKAEEDRQQQNGPAPGAIRLEPMHLKGAHLLRPQRGPRSPDAASITRGGGKSSAGPGRDRSDHGGRPIFAQSVLHGGVKASGP